METNFPEKAIQLFWEGEAPEGPSGGSFLSVSGQQSGNDADPWHPPP